jgi:phosphoribosylformimino-5-aminoimidazole carboxamide ribotide isomerase
MSRFRPCIDLHQGQVKQIVGGTLSDNLAPSENFVSDRSPTWFAEVFRSADAHGGHVIQLGPGNAAAALEALAAWPGGFQLGGGVTPGNATMWIDAGASHVIITSYLFPADQLDLSRLDYLSSVVGASRIVVDLSCRRDPSARSNPWFVAKDRWQTPTRTFIDAPTLASLEGRCAELLVHAADVEGLQDGIDTDLVEALALWSPVPVTYAGGANSLSDLQLVHDLSNGLVDLTIGSALDLYGGTGVSFDDCIAWNRRQGVSQKI